MSALSGNDSTIRTIDAISIAVGALFEELASLRSEAGLSDDELMARFSQHGDATKTAIAGYLAAL